MYRKNNNPLSPYKKKSVLYVLLIVTWVLTLGGFAAYYFSLPGGDSLMELISGIIVFLFLGSFILYGYFGVISFIIYVLNKKRMM